MTALNRWPSRALGSFCELKGGKRLPKGEDFATTKTAYPYIRITDFNDFSVDMIGLRYLRPETQVAIARYIITKRDVYVSIAGTTGVVGMVPHELDGANLTENAARIVIREIDCVTPSYLMYFLASESAQKYLHSQTVKNAQPKLALARIKSITVPLPDVTEQRQIARVLSAVQRAIERQERLIALTAELKKALMHKLFTEGARGEKLKQTEMGLVPLSWDVVDFESLSVLQRGKDLKKAEFKCGQVPVIGATTTIGFHDIANVRGPGVTVVRSGSSAGKALYIATDFWAHNVVLYVKNFRGNDPRFVYYKLCSLDLTRFKAGVAVPTLNRNAFRTMQVAVPKLAEQREIAAMLDAVEGRMSVAERTRAALADAFRTLLHQLMTAQVRVHDLDLSALDELATEPAEVA